MEEGAAHAATNGRGSGTWHDVAAQQLRTKGTDMEMAHNVSIPELIAAISERLVAPVEGLEEPGCGIQ